MMSWQSCPAARHLPCSRPCSRPWPIGWNRHGRPRCLLRRPRRSGSRKWPRIAAAGSRRSELPGLDPETDIEVTVDGRVLTIYAERRQEDKEPYRSEFRYGSVTRSVRLPAKVDATDVSARYEKGVLEVSVPVREVKPEGSRVAIEKAD